MIAKDLDPLNESELSPMEAAGRLAEEQMAFYLKQRFHDDPSVHVINDLRLDIGGIFTQIDHLVVSQYGFIAVESKSVTTEVAINERGEWSRRFDGTWRGMASPVVQVDEQLRRLVLFLSDNAPLMLGKFLGMQQRFGGRMRLGLVAVSTNGMVSRPSSSDYPLVLKADQVCALAAKHLAEWKSRSGLKGLLPTTDPVMAFSPTELQAVSSFLLARHEPRSPAPPELSPAHPEPVVSQVLALPTDSAAEVQSKQAQAAVREATPRYFCAACKRPVSEAVAKFCWGSKHRFGGKVYCMTHQKSA